MRTTHFIFAGGGTGGHVYPGLAVAEQLRAQSGEDLQFTFVCSDRPTDRVILDEEDVAMVPIRARPVSAHPLRLARFLRAWGPSLRSARRAIDSKSRDHATQVVAMGGYVSAPVARAAAVARVPLTLVNLDARPGKANRWIARSATRVFTSAPVEAPYAADWIRVPPIIRNRATASASPQECRERIGLAPERKTLMVIGGSQGAHSINQFVAAFAESHRDALEGWQVIHQTGSGDDARLRATYHELQISAVVEPFLADIGEWWGAADLALTRAGAGAVAEATVNATPAVFLPYPFHRDQHQWANCRPLIDAGAAIGLTDHVAPADNLERNASSLESVLRDPGRVDAMKASFNGSDRSNGAAMIAAQLLETA